MIILWKDFRSKDRGYFKEAMLEATGASLGAGPSVGLGKFLLATQESSPRTDLNSHLTCTTSAETLNY